MWVHMSQRGQVAEAQWLSPRGFFVFDTGHLGHSLFISCCECAQQGTVGSGLLFSKAPTGTKKMPGTQDRATGHTGMKA